MADTYRVLVTGSRTWTDEHVFYEALGAAANEADISALALTIVHGACPEGADAMAAEWCSVAADRQVPMKVTEERHPADWHPDGGALDKSAGFRRNALMVSLGASVACAFIMPCSDPRCVNPEPHGSHGATYCASLAERAGIPTRRFGP